MFIGLKKGLQEMVISDEWFSYKKDSVDSAWLVKETLVNDNWWMKVDYILAFTAPIYDVLKKINTNMVTPHFVYEMWDSMVEKCHIPIWKKDTRWKYLEYINHQTNLFLIFSNLFCCLLSISQKHF